MFSISHHFGMNKVSSTLPIRSNKNYNMARQTQAISNPCKHLQSQNSSCLAVDRSDIFKNSKINKLNKNIRLRISKLIQVLNF